ncbi:FecR family protein [Tamlana haliotis]|uniref:FecR family protein n=1 Tax=Pseudotamlana haliotis TaxID=2614804 RepID=A0A6N6MDC4_9FLAO|nr:FecR family protein [Tamlana haliotis]KAB1067714.1 FecR family protein [Tamlana haliotis]
MKHNQYTNQDFQALIEKYLDGKISIEEVKMLVNYYESFQENNEWVEELGSESQIKNKMLINILESIQEDRPVKTIPFYKKSMFKYVAAACLIASIALGFVYKLQYNKTANAVVTNNTIQSGSDKATLTLEDGSHIALEKETTYESAKLKSNGKSVVYNKSGKSEDELVYNYLTVPRGGQFVVELSDGTKVWLNSDSKLKYPVSFIKGNPREIQLVYGEAYFEVSKSTKHNGDAFSVKTNDQLITVLGTEFNVKAYKNETEILTTLVEGSIAVGNGVTNGVLRPGEQSRLSQFKNEFEIYEVEVADIISWRKGEFSFTKKPLEDIMRVLSRWYDVDVVIANEELKSVGFTGVISKQQSIEYILEIIKSTNNMNYKIENKSIVIE